MGQHVRAFLETTQARMLPLTLIPLSLGTVLVWQREKLLHWELFLVMLIGTLVLHVYIQRMRPKSTGSSQPQRAGRIWFFLCVSLLLFCGAYLIQGGEFSWQLLWAALPVGLFVTTVWYILDGDEQQCWGHPYPHDEAKKEGLMLAGCSLLILVTTIVLHVYPWYAAIAALTTPPALIVIWQVKAEKQQYARLVEAVTLAGVQSAMLLCIALFIRGSLGI